MVALLLATLVVALISRTLPQLNAVAVGLNFNSLIVLGVLAFCLGSAAWVFQEELGATIEFVAHDVPACLQPLTHCSCPVRAVACPDHMASEEFGDKTHEATPYRRQKAREEGQVVRSQDLASAGLLIVGLLVVVVFQPAAWPISSAG